ncbi:MAG: sulfotransferase [Denitromonas halophila]|nr:MAG: sulfotransferase [Denitromonas halophila]TVT73422.1 MAG: sulfotransferase [Denitromonas halophila]
MSMLSAFFANPRLLFTAKNVFLLSHMRANTTLFGHILGSSPDVEGYYEMHISYYSWKSLWRQKMLHFSDHSAKPSSRILFDKILHDGHHITPAMLTRNDTRALLMIREPEQSIKSIVTLYRKTSPDLPEATIQGAATYYIDRLETLAAIATTIPGKYFYLDAEALVSASDDTLAAITQWLGLSQPLTTEYELFERSAKGNSGDNSDALRSGAIQVKKSNYADIELPPELLNRASETYARCREKLVQHADQSMTHRR